MTKCGLRASRGDYQLRQQAACGVKLPELKGRGYSFSPSNAIHLVMQTLVILVHKS